ncbi:hypothetical protein AQUCO_00900867v1 [Aquilegia coerulea]|uniref:Uncharacterized protein n=1 Tax=Aquilegia coerulea TaxID=218851 RepID=A0A2G5EFR5_AQUCA|nr:hypothetical protein AQUCO_00900867v1 [Aquilegia coerulea]
MDFRSPSFQSLLKTSRFCILVLASLIVGWLTILRYRVIGLEREEGFKILNQQFPWVYVASILIILLFITTILIDDDDDEDGEGMKPNKIGKSAANNHHHEKVN